MVRLKPLLCTDHHWAQRNNGISRHDRAEGMKDVKFGDSSIPYLKSVSKYDF